MITITDIENVTRMIEREWPRLDAANAVGNAIERLLVKGGEFNAKRLVRFARNDAYRENRTDVARVRREVQYVREIAHDNDEPLFVACVRRDRSIEWAKVNARRSRDPEYKAKRAAERRAQYHAKKVTRG